MFRLLMCTGLLASAAAAPACAEDRSTDQAWLDLWTRCRTSIEQVAPLDVAGLESDKSLQTSTTPPMTAELPDGSDLQVAPTLAWVERTWRDPGSPFAIREWIWPDDQRRNCDVGLQEHRNLSETELLEVVSAFEAERNRLVTAGGHEYRPLDRVMQFFSGVGPTQKNAAGCSVISTLAFGPDYFSAANGEQAFDSSCIGRGFVD